MTTPSPDKAVILARGLGTRMRRAGDDDSLSRQQAAVADSGIKALIPIDRPFLDYVLSALADAGYGRVCLVVGPEHDTLRDYYGQLGVTRLSIEFAVQYEPKGTADAVLAAEAFADADHFLVINSDNYYPVEALRRIRRQKGSAVALFEQDAMLAGSNVSADRIKQFAVARLDGDQLQAILEKPDAEVLAAMPRPLWVSMNCWRFGPSIFEACRAIEPSPRGEFEIPDAVQYAMGVLGEPFDAIRVQAPVLDLSSRQDIGPVTERLTDVEVRL